MEKSPIRPTDDAARALARDLLDRAKFAAIAVLDPDTGAPFVSRIAFAHSPDNHPITLISTLAFHTQALQKNPLCSLLVGEPPDKGDPLAFSRITLAAKALILPADQKNSLRKPYLKSHPKAQLYIDFADFHFVSFVVSGAMLNGGFGKAYNLTANDLI